MALQLPTYTDDRGNEYNESYWRIENFNIDIRGRYLSWTLRGYKNLLARNSNRSPVGERGYSISGEEFDATFEEETAKLKNIREIAYQKSKNRKDVGTGTFEVEGAGTPNARPIEIRKSFFDGALDV